MPQETNFGPYEGDPNAAPGSLQYRLWRDGFYDSRGNPHRAGNIALSPDQVRGARYGDTVTRGGLTGRFTDVTNSRLTNRFDRWSESRPGSTNQGNNRSTATNQSAAFNPMQEGTGGMQIEPGPLSGSDMPDTGLPSWWNQASSTETQQPSVQVSGETAIPSVGGRSPSLIDDPNNDWTGNSVAGANPFDEWWRGTDTVTTGNAAGQAGASDGGTIWGEAEGIFGYPDVSGDLAVGTGANRDSGAQGEAETTFEYPNGDGTGIPVEPDMLPQDYEWTTSPEDRRFLDEAPAEDASNSGGVNFGGDSMSNFGGNLSLGGFLNTPLSTMRYGEGYPAQGTNIETGQAAQDEYFRTHPGSQQPVTGDLRGAAELDSSSGGAWVERSDGSGSDWVENATSGSGDFLTPPPTAGMTIVGHDNRTGAPIYRDSNGNLFVDPGTGTRITPGIAGAINRGDYTTPFGTSPMAAASAFAMMNAGMSPSLRQRAGGRISEAGRTEFDPSKGAGHIDPETGFIRRTEGGMLANNPWADWSYDDQMADTNRTRIATGRSPFSAGGRGR